MPQPTWKRLGLTPEEWHDCRLAALELTLAGPVRVTAEQVAVEFALARTFEDPAMDPDALGPTDEAPRPASRGSRSGRS